MFGIEVGLILGYAVKLVVFGVLFALLHPLFERLLLRAPPSSLARRAGLALFAGALFGAVDLYRIWGTDVLPASVGLASGTALALAMIAGLAVIHVTAPARRP